MNRLNMYRWGIILVAVFFAMNCVASGKLRPNGFDLSEATIPVKDILDGGVGIDGIPAIHQPKFLKAEQINYLDDSEIVISFTAKNGSTRAYPIRILIKHEIVNDQLGDQSFIVSYCPLCASAMVFDAKVDGKVLSFGVSGLLYQSDVLMYDRETMSLWTQLGMRSVSGANARKRLKWLPSEQMRFGAWKKKYPKGEVLSKATGFPRNYEHSGYGAYFKSPETMFPVSYTRKELPKKSYIAGVIRNGKTLAFPLKQMPRDKLIEIKIGGELIKVIYEKEGSQVKAYREDGKTPVPVVVAFWFAWQAFYPETKIWEK